MNLIVNKKELKKLPRPVRKEAVAKPKIMHFGPGAFFRSFVASLINDVNQKDVEQWGIIAVSLNSEGTFNKLVGQDLVFNTLSKSIGKKRIQKVSSLSDFFVAKKQGLLLGHSKTSALFFGHHKTKVLFFGHQKTRALFFGHQKTSALFFGQQKPRALFSGHPKTRALFFGHQKTKGFGFWSLENNFSRLSSLLLVTCGRNQSFLTSYDEKRCCWRIHHMQ